MDATPIARYQLQTGLAGEQQRLNRCVMKEPWRFAMMILIVCVGTAPLAAPQSAPTEYQLKAAYLYNFAKFVDWPADAFASPQSPFLICILGTDPFGNVIDEALRGKTIEDHPVVVERAKESSDARHCQMVFVSSSEKKRIREILGTLRGSHVLIVGESESFAESGGMIQLVLEENRVRFAINTGAAESAGLHISSKLLALARIVRSPESGKN